MLVYKSVYIGLKDVATSYQTNDCGREGPSNKGKGTFIFMGLWGSGYPSTLSL